MYYCLKDDILLRGWEKLPTGIVQKGTGRLGFVQPEIYHAIKDMGSLLFENSPLITSEQKKGLEEMVKAGIMEKCDSPKPLSEEQQYKRYNNRLLQSIHWSITGNCNCRCLHCYMSAPTGEIGEPTLEECLNIADQMGAAGVLNVSLTGGEALVRRDFFDIVDRLLENGIHISTIMSNGLMVNENLLKKFEDRGIHPEFNMSFDGIGIHDWLRGIPGVEKAVIRAFELCREHGFPTGAEYCLHKDNLDVFRESVKLLGDLGCKTLKVNRIRDEGEGVNIRDYMITMEQELEFYLDYIPQFYEDGEPLRLMLSGTFMNVGEKKAIIPNAKRLEKNDCDNYCLCGHARNYMYITPDGFIVPCIVMGSVENGRSHFPSIHDMTLVEALNDSSYMDFIDTRLRTYFEKHKDCAECEYRNRCAGGCRGIAAMTGDIMDKDLDSCVFFKQGWYDKVCKALDDLGVQYPKEKGE